MTTADKLQGIITAAEEGKAELIETIDIQEKTHLADYFVLCSGNSDVHIRAISDRIQDALGDTGVKSKRIEGYTQAVWILLDYGDVVVHIMREEERERYKLEELWKSTPKLEQKRSEEEAG